MHVDSYGETGKHSTVSLGVAVRNLRFTDEVQNIKDSLREFFEEWLSSEAASDAEIRSTMITHFNALYTLLDAINAENHWSDTQNFIICDEKKHSGEGILS